MGSVSDIAGAHPDSNSFHRLRVYMRIKVWLHDTGNRLLIREASPVSPQDKVVEVEESLDPIELLYRVKKEYTARGIPVPSGFS